MTKYCIWDVGNVIYRYSLDPLKQWVEKNGSEKPQQPLFNFNPYMKGDVSYTQTVRELCRKYGIQYFPATAQKVRHLLEAGIGEYFPETRQAQLMLKSRGITNCLLSNALPVLENSSRTEDIIRPEHRFTSYKLGLLKPDPKIYQTVLKELNAQPQEVIFIDDKEKNVAAACSLGIHGIQFKRETIISEIKSSITQMHSTKNHPTPQKKNFYR